MLAQRFDGEIEFLFIDGGSEDRTVEILRELAAARPARAVLDNPRRAHADRRSTSASRARAGRLRRAHGRPHPLSRRLPRARASSGCAAAASTHVSGPQLAARRRHLVAPGRARARHAGSARGGAQLPATPPRARSRSTAASPASGGARRSRSTAAGTRAGPTTRTPSWRRASAAAAAASSACPRWARRVHPARQPEGARRASTGATASTAPRPAATTRRACAARTCSPPAWRCHWRPRACRSAPRPLGRLRRRARRATVVGVALAVSAGEADSARGAAPRRRRRRCPLVFATMHLSWGLGFLLGCVALRPAAARRWRASSARRA